MSNEEIDEALSWSKQYMKYVVEVLHFKYRVIDLFKQTGNMISSEIDTPFLSLEQFTRKTQR